MPQLHVKRKHKQAVSCLRLWLLLWRTEIATVWTSRRLGQGCQAVKGIPLAPGCMPLWLTRGAMLTANPVGHLACDSARGEIADQFQQKNLQL